MRDVGEGGGGEAVALLLQRELGEAEALALQVLLHLLLHLLVLHDGEGRRKGGEDTTTRWETGNGMGRQGELVMT